MILHLNVALYGPAQDTLYLGAYMYLMFANTLLIEASKSFYLLPYFVIVRRK